MKKPLFSVIASLFIMVTHMSSAAVASNAKSFEGRKLYTTC